MAHLTVPSLSRRTFTLSLAGVSLLRSQSREMHWALLSDIHIPKDPADTYRGFKPVDNLAKVIPQVVESKAEGMLICGDLARLEGKPEDYSALKTLVEPVGSKTPMALALGNHDDRANFLQAFGGAQSGVQAVKGKHVVVVDGPALRFIVLDSLIQANNTPGFLGKAQRDWLDGYLKSSPSKPTLIFVHHTLDDNDGALLDAPRLFETVKPYRQVKAILFGHSHAYNYNTWEGIHLINLPAVAFNFKDDEPVGWVDAKLTPDGGSFTLRAFGGNMAQNGQTKSLAWRG